MTKLITSRNIFDFIEKNPRLAPTSKRKYTEVLAAYFANGGNLFDVGGMGEYALSLNDSARRQFSAVINLWASSTIRTIKGLARPDNLPKVQAAILQLESIQGTVTGTNRNNGNRAHTWLTAPEVKRLLGTCAPLTNKGQRDRLVLAILVGAGLRRTELVELRFADIIIQPNKATPRRVLNINGKGDKPRIVPISDRLAVIIDEWAQRVGYEGLVARSVTRYDTIESSLSDVGILNIVRAAGTAIGHPNLSPHDLRRSYAQIGYEAGIPLTQISKLLGHSSLATTQKYLNLDIDLDSTISDFIPL